MSSLKKRRAIVGVMGWYRINRMNSQSGIVLEQCHKEEPGAAMSKYNRSVMKTRTNVRQKESRVIGCALVEEGEGEMLSRKKPSYMARSIMACAALGGVCWRVYAAAYKRFKIFNIKASKNSISNAR